MEEAMDNFSLEELKAKFLQLLDITKCAICLESVQKDAVQCTNGHLLCLECKTNLQVCPTCRDEFSSSKPPHFVTQVIDILPIRCRYKDCSTILKIDDDHEIYCGFRPTKCKWCEWKGPGKDIRSHCDSDHNCNLYRNLIMLRNFDIDKKSLKFSSCQFEDQFFWIESLNDPDRNMFITTWHIVPNGKPESDIFVKSSFKSESGPYTATKIKLNLNPDEPHEENSISIPHRLLLSFIDSRGNVVNSIVMSAKDFKASKENLQFTWIFN